MKRFELPPGIDRRRLRKELIIVGSLLLIVVSVSFFPWLFSQPFPNRDLYSGYKHLYNQVVNYDYSKGPSDDLEARINRALESNSTSTQIYFNLKARIEYNYRLGNYDLVESDLDQARAYAPTYSEYEYVEKLSDEILNK